MKGAFWQAEFEVKAIAGAARTAASPLLGAALPLPRGQPGHVGIVIDVIKFDREIDAAGGVTSVSAARRSSGITVLISMRDRDDDLSCRLGFDEGVARCDALREGGFPMIESVIHWNEDEGALSIRLPCFGGDEHHPRQAMQWDTEVLTLTGVTLAKPIKQAAKGRNSRARSKAVSVEGAFAQAALAPDPNEPSTQLALTPRRWRATRSDIDTIGSEKVTASVELQRFPNLIPLSGSLCAGATTCGNLELTLRRQRATPLISRAPRSGFFVEGAYDFPDVEALGFRIDLSRFGAAAEMLLNKWVEPLNFHLRNDAGAIESPRDFRYQAASRTVLIELLRYNKMVLQEDDPPLSTRDYQAQHELLLRVLVGRVDDDTTQARDPAVFVPAIFVDNPWSKVLGREVQGFDKRLALFRSCGHRLRPDGCYLNADLGSDPIPLTAVDRISLAEQVGRRSGRPLLRLSCPAQDVEDFYDADLQVALGGVFRGGRWRQADFEDVEFRRAFAHSAMADDILGFRSIQVAPIVERGLPRSWVSGQFTVQSARIANPTGIATLKLYAPAEAPAPWRELCQLLGNARAAEVAFPTGDWYRIKSSMSLTVDAGLSG